MTAMSGGNIAIVICMRCGFKFPYRALMFDGDIPKLRVCQDCRDDKDPYKLPPRQADPVALRYARPDRSIVEHSPFLMAGEQYSDWILQGPDNVLLGY